MKNLSHLPLWMSVFRAVLHCWRVHLPLSQPLTSQQLVHICIMISMFFQIHFFFLKTACYTPPLKKVHKACSMPACRNQNNDWCHCKLICPNLVTHYYIYMCVNASSKKGNLRGQEIPLSYLLVLRQISDGDQDFIPTVSYV